MDRARWSPLRDNSDKGKSSCIDHWVQGESDQFADDEEQKKRSLIQSLIIVEVLQYPDKDKLMAQIFPKSDNKEYQHISRDV